MKQVYLLGAFLLILLSIFIQVLIVEIQFFDIEGSAFMHFDQKYLHSLAVILITALWILSIYSFYKFSIILNKERLALEADRMQLEESEKLVRVLRQYKHDFRNQLQVIRTMAQLGKTEEVVAYIKDCSREMDFSNTAAANINNPAFSAMLLFFASDCKEKGIDFQVDADINFDGFGYSPAKMTRLLGNIIRNAIEVLERSESRERNIQITLWQNDDSYNFLIWNNGPVIPETLLGQIFSPGFSTKGSTGLGLAISRELVEELGGSIAVSSLADTGTEFRIAIPYKSSCARTEKEDAQAGTMGVIG